MALVPVLIIPPTVWIFKQRVSWMEAAGAAVAVCGVALLFIK
jgi:drug/metabolite transporter (DMT)-like permease